MPEPVAESAVRAKVIKGLESVKPAEIQAHLQSGLDTAQRKSRVAQFGDQIEKQLGDKLTAAKTATEQTKSHWPFKDVHAKRVDADTKIKTAKTRKNQLRTQEKSIKKIVRLTDSLEAGESVIPESDQPKFGAEAKAIHATTESSLKQISEKRAEAERQEKAERKNKRALGYTKALVDEASKVIPHIGAKGAEKNLQATVDLTKQTGEVLPEYYAGQEVLALRVQEQAKTGQPLEDAFWEASKALDKAVASTRKTEMRLANKIDKTVKDPELKKGRFSETVRAAHVEEDLAIAREAQALVESLGKEVTAEAVTSAANRVRTLIEKPGFGKKTLETALLTKAGLQEAIEGKDIIDPLRKVVYRHLSGKQKSVEEVLGCEITVTGEGKGRLIEVKMAEQEKKESSRGLRVKRWAELDNESEENPQQKTETSLFKNMVRIEATEDALRKQMLEVDPTDLSQMRVLTEALKTVASERKALIKLSNVKINAVFTADGVRSGAVKTRLGESTVKGVEAAGAAGIAGAITYFGTPETFFGLFKLPHIEGIIDHIGNAKTIVEGANQTMAPIRETIAAAKTQIGALRDLIANGPAQLQALVDSLKGISPNDITSAIEQSKNAADVLDKLGPVVDKVNQMQVLTNQMSAAPGQITGLEQNATQATSELTKVINEALTGTAGQQAEAMKDLAIGGSATAIAGLSFSEAVRKLAGAPGRAVRNLIGKVRGY